MAGLMKAGMGQAVVKGVATSVGERLLKGVADLVGRAALEGVVIGGSLEVCTLVTGSFLMS